MTSTRFNVGLNNATRNSSKVLKPPGGGSSDIFGTTEHVEPQKKVRSHLTSSIFAEETAAPSRNKAGNSSFYNLFGNEPQIIPLTDSSNKSNIIPDKLKSGGGNKVAEESRIRAWDDIKEEESANEATVANGDLGETHGNARGCDSMKDDPPVKSEAASAKSEAPSAKSEATSAKSEAKSAKSEATSAMNGIASSTNSAVSSAAPTPTNPAPSAGRQRIPPGGFSSGLW